jgi:hypothetical protein
MVLFYFGFADRRLCLVVIPFRKDNIVAKATAQQTIVCVSAPFLILFVGIIIAHAPDIDYN